MEFNLEILSLIRAFWLRKKNFHWTLKKLVKAKTTLFFLHNIPTMIAKIDTVLYNL